MPSRDKTDTPNENEKLVAIDQKNYQFTTTGTGGKNGRVYDGCDHKYCCQS